MAATCITLFIRFFIKIHKNTYAQYISSITAGKSLTGFIRMLEGRREAPDDTADDTGTADISLIVNFCFNRGRPVIRTFQKATFFEKAIERKAEEI